MFNSDCSYIFIIYHSYSIKRAFNMSFLERFSLTFFTLRISIIDMNIMKLYQWTLFHNSIYCYWDKQSSKTLQNKLKWEVTHLILYILSWSPIHIIHNTDWVYWYHMTILFHHINILIIFCFFYSSSNLTSTSSYALKLRMFIHCRNHLFR